MVIQIDSVMDSLRELEGAGGTVFARPFKSDIGIYALMTDIEGNPFGLWRALQLTVSEGLVQFSRTQRRY